MLVTALNAACCVLFQAMAFADKPRTADPFRNSPMRSSTGQLVKGGRRGNEVVRSVGHWD